MRFLGLDLAGAATNPTGYALLSRKRFRTGLIYSNEEILDLCCRERPKLIALDAPLSFPRRGGLRKADRELIRRGYRVFPPGFGGMRRLTERAIELARKLRRRGFKVIEIHPRTSGVVLFNTPERRKWLLELRGEGWRLSPSLSKHEVDAVLAAYTAWLHALGRTELVGSPREGLIAVPLTRGGASRVDSSSKPQPPKPQPPA